MRNCSFRRRIILAASVYFTFRRKRSLCTEMYCKGLCLRKTITSYKNHFFIIESSFHCM